MKQARRPVRGFGLVELIVALTILSVGLLGLTAAAVVAYRGLTTAAAMERATSAAASVLDSLVAERTPVTGDRVLHDVRVRWIVTPMPHGTSAITAVVDIGDDGGRPRTLRYETLHAAATTH